MSRPVIFVVDDDAAVRTAVRRLLLPLRYPVRPFASAEQFLDETDSAVRGCLIVDVRLPGMDGLQLQQQLAEREWKLPVVFITALEDDETRDVAIRRGAIAYLRKPFGGDRLLAGVRDALSRCGI